MKRNTFILSLIMLLFCLADLHSQILAVKSDLLTGALSSPNFGVEVKLSNRLTLEAGFHYNPFPAGGDKRWKHWFVQPELRYWMCQPFGGHFYGVHLLYGVYNVGGMKIPSGLLREYVLQDMRGLHGAGSIIRLPLYSRPPVEYRDKRRRRISAYRIRTATVVCIAVNRPVAN